MASLLWGNVYYQDTFAGVLREEPGGRVSFTYDETYLQSNMPPIAYTLPLQTEPHINESGLHPFFDNLVAEGWLEGAQTRLLGKRQATRFELLLAFGRDCAGAVWIADPSPRKLDFEITKDTDPKEIALMTSQASLSGVQPKFVLIERNHKFYPVKQNEISTHIGKFPSKHHYDLVLNEYLATIAFKTLLPNQDCVTLSIDEIVGFDEPVLIIKRFDRNQNKRLHFEEFNQLLNQPSIAKYDGSYKNIADFIYQAGGLPTEIYHLYVRILAGFLLGNTDMHLKNFAMFHTEQGYRLTPTYDTVSAVIYDYKSLALSIGGTKNLAIGKLKANHIVQLGKEFNLSTPAINMAVNELSLHVNAAKEAVFACKIGSNKLKDQIIKWIEKRWNGTFALIGPLLLKKP